MFLIYSHNKLFFLKSLKITLIAIYFLTSDYILSIRKVATYQYVELDEIS